MGNDLAGDKVVPELLMMDDPLQCNHQRDVEHSDVVVSGRDEVVNVNVLCGTGLPQDIFQHKVELYPE